MKDGKNGLVVNEQMKQKNPENNQPKSNILGKFKGC